MDARELNRRSASRTLSWAIFLISIVITIVTLVSFFTAPPSSAASVSSVRAVAAASVIPGNRALNWAETQRGVPYAWGGIGPWGYDCSGLVYEAFLHAGINISRDTFTQLSSWGNGHFHIVPWGQERRGDIAFYGTSHEEIMTDWWHQTFGAQVPGTRVGWHEWSGWWQPTMFVRVY